MSDNKLSPVSQEAVDEIEHMQRCCVVTSYKVISLLEDGVSELQVANMFAEELAKEGVTDYWYKFPRGVERMVLFGEKRFQDMVSEKYEEKTPREDVKLKPGDIIYFDLHPRSKSGYWGNFAASGIYKPEEKDKRVAFIENIQRIQKEVIKQLYAGMTGRDVYALFEGLYKDEGISPVDVNGNFGHRMLHVYLEKPAIAALILIVLCLWVYCATHLRKCAVSMQAARKIWFVVFAAIVGTVLSKETTNSTDIVRGMYGFAFVRALMMVVVWTFFFYARKPVTSAVLFSRNVWRYSLIIGGVNAVAEVLGVLSLYHVDNPAYTAAVGYLNSFFILIAYAVMGRKNDGNVIAGIGMVACAAALIILKAQV